MKISKNLNGSTLTISPAGRLDTVSAPMLEEEIQSSVNGVTELIFDLSELEYISSAGLRVLLSAQKQMNKQGLMTIKKAKDSIMQIFEITGFTDVFKIEN